MLLDINYQDPVLIGLFGIFVKNLLFLEFRYIESYVPSIRIIKCSYLESDNLTIGFIIIQSIVGRVISMCAVCNRTDNTILSC